MAMTMNRRQALGGIAAAGLAAAGAKVNPAVAAEHLPLLSIENRILEVKGRAAKVFAILNENGGHGFNMLAGEEFRARVVNRLGEETLLHWHGLNPPLVFDGVPMLSGPTMKPGETRDYVFKNRETGTHWMHSHVGLQEQLMLAAPLIIRESDAPLHDEQEHVVMLHDFTFRDPAEILAELKGGGGAHGGHAMPGGQMDHSTMDHSAQGAGEMTMPSMNMPSMVNDIEFDAFLANDRTLDDPEVVQAEKGGRFRLRIINGSAASNLWIDLGELEGELIAVDGKAVRPVRDRRFPLAIAQRADIRLALPPGSGAWPILFKGEGTTLQSGIILRSGEAPVAKISDRAEKPEAIVGLALEARLRSLVTVPEIAVSRSDMLMLGGGGADYVWTLNGKSGMHEKLFTLREGERYEIMLHNMTNMAHPMHLHGHYFKVVAVGMQRVDGAVRDTVLVPAMDMVTIQFDANNPGTWAFHCHHIYHMNSGMMGSVAYAGAA
ncbi:MAG: multicopper oxidase family protein [Proteobacteria bacterium]|nr:multicopper oxidase family protein [Pseudomonadota bacterium]